MRKIIFFIISFLFIFNSIASACNFKIANFGDSKESIQLSSKFPEPLLLPDRFGGENLIIPIEEICETSKNLWGTKLIYLYIENKLSRIQLYRPLMEDRNLMDFAMQKYGKFNLPEGLPKNKWRGNNIWDKNLEVIEYMVTDIHDGHVEILEVVNKLYLPTLENYNEKVGEWLDSGQ
jgi:hypothetical protein